MGKNNALNNLLVKKFVSLGARSDVADFAAAQAMYESAHGLSNIAKTHNNLSGIKYVGQKGAAPGLPSPEGNKYAHYNSLNDWASDFVRILKMNPGRPWYDSKDLGDYAARLKTNGYFTDSLDRYYKNLASVYNSYLPTGPYQRPKAPGVLDPAYKEYVRSGQARRQANEEVRTAVHKQRVWEAEQAKKAEIEAGIPQNRFEQWVDDFSKGTTKALVIGGIALVGLLILTRR
jgi:hypothetical protein